MKYYQRDIVEVSFLFPDGTFKPHPAIIVSNDQLQEDEEGHSLADSAFSALSAFLA